MVQAKCACCGKAADTYCVDCKKAHCRFCVFLQHHPTTKAEKHSIEEFVIKRKWGVQLVSVILLDVVCAGTVFYMLSEIGISPEYFRGVSYCPALSKGRWMLARFDPNLFYYYKGALTGYCDFEDSYWRFLMDSWVRSVLTATDGWVLLLSTIWKAWLFEKAVKTFAAPLIAVIYAVLAKLVFLLESNIPATETLVKVEGVLIKLSLSRRLKAVGSPPPPTLPRKKPATDFVEGAKYWKSRWFRHFQFYRAQAQATVNWMLAFGFYSALIVRVSCLLLGIGGLLRDVTLLCGFREAAAQHVQWFRDETGVQVGADGRSVVDWLLALGIHQAVERSKVIGIAHMSKIFVSGFAILRRVMVPAALVLTPVIAFHQTIRRQQKAFDKKWQDGGREEIWGDASREAPCHNWQNIRFENI